MYKQIKKGNQKHSFRIGMLFSLIVILLCNLKHYLLQLIIIHEKNLKLNKETGVELAIKQKRPTFLNKVVAPFSDNYESSSFFFL